MPPSKGKKSTRSTTNLNNTSTPTKPQPPTLMKTNIPYEELLETIARLSKRVSVLEGEMCMLRSELVVSSHVNSVLNAQIDDQEQYSRRSCMIVDGILPTTKESTHDLKLKIQKIITKSEDPEDLGGKPPISVKQFNEEFDKCHRVGPVKNGRQSAIVKFKSHGFREEIYRRRKTITKKTGNKLRISLTRHRSQLLAKANFLAEQVKRVKFAFADVDGNLRLLLNQPFRDRWTVPFTSEQELELKLVELGDEGDGYYSDLSYGSQFD